ncbi:3-keto-5-aminohexanoate cleavage protein [Sphingomonas sp. MMS24-JH45]
MSPYLPVTAEEIAEAARARPRPGRRSSTSTPAIPKNTGRPDQSPEAFEPFLRIIKQRSDVVVNLTTGGSPYMSVEERIRPAAVWKPEVASLNMGSMNFGLFPLLNRFKQFEHEWNRRCWRAATTSSSRSSFKASSLRAGDARTKPARATNSNATTRRCCTTCTISGARGS